MSNKTKRNKKNKKRLGTRKRKSNYSKPSYYNGIYTGVKWQCVEFVRRYLIIKHGVTFSDVDSAFQIPNAKFTRLDGTHIKMEHDLIVGSIIVWAKNIKQKMPDGHVAIVKSITPTGITVVEQNYRNNKFTRFIKNKDLKNVTILSLPV